jgi:aminocarboxymuconate-semialdehyde decarboxylase
MPGIDLHTHLAPTVDDRVGPADLYRPDKLLAHLDAAGLDEAVVSIPPPFYRQNLASEAATAWARAVNDGLLAVTDAHERFTPLAYLPLDDPGAALKEYLRLREDTRWGGVTAAAGGSSVSLADDRLDPLWDALNRDARTVFLHPGSSPDNRLAPFYLANLLGNPVETTLAAAELVFGDVLVRYPAVRVILAHCGGLLPAVVGRWQRGVDTARPGIPPLSEPPRVAVRRFYVDCLAHDPAVVDLAASVFGEDKVVLGSDWPFPMGTNDPVDLVAHRGEDFATATAIENACTALGR